MSNGPETMRAEAGRNEERSQRPWRTMTVAAFAALLVVQGYFSFTVKPEPYPSIRMPNFGTAAAEDGTFEISVARAEVVNEDGTVQQLSPTDLMNEFRFSTARPSYDYLFLKSDPSGVTPEVQEWLRNRLRVLTPDRDPVELRMCWRQTVVSVSDASVVSQRPCVWKVVPL